jgi:chorismate mutase-like protein
MREHRPAEAWPWARSSPAGIALHALIALVAERLCLGVDVAAVKFASGSPIDDPAREQEILGRAAAAGPGRAGPGHQVAFLRDQISANKAIQRGLHDHWRRAPAGFLSGATAATGDIRARLDDVSSRMLTLLPHVQPMTGAELAAAGSLIDHKLTTRPPLDQLRHLRRTASHTALQSLGHPPLTSDQP